MTFWIIAGVLEAAIVAGSGMDARWRPAAQRRPWVARWALWHLAPLWLVWLGLIAALMRGAEVWARASLEHQRRRYRLAQAMAGAEPI